MQGNLSTKEKVLPAKKEILQGLDNNAHQRHILIERKRIEMQSFAVL